MNMKIEKSKMNTFLFDAGVSLETSFLTLLFLFLLCKTEWVSNVKKWYDKLHHKNAMRTPTVFDSRLIVSRKNTITCA